MTPSRWWKVGVSGPAMSHAPCAAMTCIAHAQLGLQSEWCARMCELPFMGWRQGAFWTECRMGRHLLVRPGQRSVTTLTLPLWVSCSLSPSPCRRHPLPALDGQGPELHAAPHQAHDWRGSGGDQGRPATGALRFEDVGACVEAEACKQLKSCKHYVAAHAAPAPRMDQWKGTCKAACAQQAGTTM